MTWDWPGWWIGPALAGAIVAGVVTHLAYSWRQSR